MPKAREGGLILLSAGGLRGPPPKSFLNFERFLVRFNGGLCLWDQSFWSRSFVRKDISCHAKNQMLDKIVFSHIFFFHFFLQHFSLTLFHLCPSRFWKVLLALILGGTSKSRVFKKIYTFQLHVEHP